MIDSHEHLEKEPVYLEHRPDILENVFGGYLTEDLIVAGATPTAIERLIDSSDLDLERRFTGIAAAWERCRQTGYGEAAQLTAKHVYGIAEISWESILNASGQDAVLQAPGERLRLLRDVAGLDHVQIDDYRWVTEPDPSGLDFFLYDLSINRFARGAIEVETLQAEVGVEVTNLATLARAMEAVFAKYGPRAIAVKSQHAYQRTLDWQAREDADATVVLDNLLAGATLSEADQRCLGDWCLACGVELAGEYGLPVKIHTGYLAGHGFMEIDRVRAGQLSALLARYPDTRFVLMHISYPYGDELVALAKHYPNVYVDLCWAWSIDPWATSDFVRRVIHAVPDHKLFGFGGDTDWPAQSVGYAFQARKWLTWTLQQEIDDGFLIEQQAMDLATRFLRTNQQECFDIEGTRAAIQTVMAEGSPSSHM